jgi:nucleoid-associated protein YgaU
MTSDAKIGLLLGLVFIFVIAFIINGLPGLHQKDDSNKLTTNMVGLESNPSGIGANERKVQMAMEQPAAPVTNGVQSQSPEITPGATVTPLPQGTPVAAESAQFGPLSAQPTPGSIGVAPVPAQMTPAVSIDPTVSTAMQDAPAGNAQPAATEQTKVYVVQSGDSISGIAKKVYGVKEGVKLKNIDAIFAANRKTLASKDSLQVGQKLTIPPLPGLTAAPATPAEVLTDKNFTKVESTAPQHSTANTSKPEPAPKAEKPAPTAKSGSVYVVKEGDSLWKIAASQLGDGNRYKDIVKLNSDVLSSEDDIAAGMQLKMPAK